MTAPGIFWPNFCCTAASWEAVSLKVASGTVNVKDHPKDGTQFLPSELRISSVLTLARPSPVTPEPASAERMSFRSAFKGDVTSILNIAWSGFAALARPNAREAVTVSAPAFVCPQMSGAYSRNTEMARTFRIAIAGHLVTANLTVTEQFD